MSSLARAPVSGGVALSQRSPSQLVDRALSQLRHGGFARCNRGWFAALPLSAAVVALYAVERVEDVHVFRPLFALVLVLCFVYRVHAQSRLARELVLELRPALPLPSDAGDLANTTVTAGVLGIGLWPWLWPLAMLAKLSPFALLAFLPVLALRGAVAPGLLARAGCTNERGIKLLGAALDDNAGSRTTMFWVELLMQLAQLALFINFYALSALVLVLGGSMFGLDTAFVSAFLSPDNDLLMLTLGAAGFIAMEPLRAAVSAHAFADARSRRDGADLHAMVDALITADERRRDPARRNAGVSAAMVLLALLAPCFYESHARADDASSHTPSSTADSTSHARAADAAARETITRILQRREFNEVARGEEPSFWKWLVDYLEKLFEQDPEQEKKPRSLFELELPPVSPWLIVSLALLAVSLLLWQQHRLRRTTREKPASSDGASAEALPERAPLLLLDDAAMLAERGDLAAAMRVLYLATLGALDRARLIRFEPSHTNGQYLRAMRSGSAREHFRSFTWIFDRTWYGREPATRDDYERCRELATRICSTEPQA